MVATDRGRERHYALRSEGLGPVTALFEELSGTTRVWRLGDGALDALDTEVRRTGRDRRAREEQQTSTRHEEIA